MNIIHRCSNTAARYSIPAPNPAIKPRARAEMPEKSRGYFAQDAADRCATLTNRQVEALVLLAKGIEYRDAAAIMGCGAATARDLRKAIYKKLEVGSAVEAAVLAAKAGLV